ncbi:Flp family type IVb pilin [Helcococcus ovis]|uniref:Flp family type IVb pilin n=1 Tax=Helcococcus ovis TaxID=72026 RepID=UPI0038B7F268
MWGEDRQAWKILALISVVVIVILSKIGTNLQGIFTKISEQLGKAATPGQR